MQNNPNAVVIDGVTIADISSFRYGMQLDEQRFFELRFPQSAFGSAFTFGLDDPAKYKDQLIELYFKDYIGRLKSTTGTIVGVEFVKSPGQPAEVFIKGSAPSSSGKTVRFGLFLIGMILAPVLGWAILFTRIENLKNDLIEKQGTTQTFHSHNAKGFRTYSFKINKVPATFTRRYSRSFKTLASDDIVAIFGNDIGDISPDEKTKPVKFYILRNDQSKLQQQIEPVNFFYLEAQIQHQSNTHLYYDLLDYVAATTLFNLLSLLCIILSGACYIGVYFYYSSRALNTNKWCVIAYHSAGLAAIVLNLMLVILN